MKKNILSALALCAVVGLSSCDSFLELEPLDKVSGDKLTETDGGMKALLATIYAAVLWKILYSVPTQVSMPVTMTV